MCNSASLVFKVGHDDHTASGRDPRASGVFALLPSTQDNLVRMTTVGFSTLWHRGVLPSLRRAYPFMMPVFLQQNEFTRILVELEKSFARHYELTIHEVAVREPRPGQAPSRARLFRLDTNRKWTHAPLHDVLAQVEERRQWFTSVRFSLRTRSTSRGPSRVVARGRLYKTCELQVDGLYREITDEILPRIEEYASKRVALLSHRGLKERKYKAAKPIVIDFGDQVFSDQAQLQRFVKVMACYPNSSKAVLHSNPYYHSSIADLRDGSSIDVWVLNPTRVLLVPQARSTPQAFNRLIHYVFSKFQEGVVREHHAEP